MQIRKMAQGEAAAGAVVTELVDLTAVRAAAARLRNIVRRTPLLPVDWEGCELDVRAGGRLWLKCECLQFSGAFKLRGAYNFSSCLAPSALASGLVTYSSGNHGQGVAWAARSFGVPAIVVMPVDAPRIKVDAVRRLGAELEQAGTTTRDRKALAEEILASRGGTMVPPFDDPHIIAGQGTVGLELYEQLEAVGERNVSCGTLRLVVVPVGGGGLISGVAAAIRALAPEARVVGVEPQGAAKMSRSLEAGRAITLDTIDTVADGLKPVRPGDLTFHHCQALVDEVVTVPDEAIRRAVVWCYGQRLVVEPSGAASIAAIATGRVAVPPEGETVVVLSGGNLDPALLREWLEES
jgi:threonine dehydratase